MFSGAFSCASVMAASDPWPTQFYTGVSLLSVIPLPPKSGLVLGLLCPVYAKGRRGEREREREARHGQGLARKHPKRSVESEIITESNLVDAAGCNGS